MTKKSSKWYGRLPGTSKPIPLSTNKVAAGQMLAEKIKRAELRKAGVNDPFEDHTKRPLAGHLADYRRYLEAEGNCPEYVAKTVSRVSAVVAGCSFVFIQDVTSEKVAEFLHGLRRDPPRPALAAGQEWFTTSELAAALGGMKPAKLGRVLSRERLRAVGNGKARRYPRQTVEALQDRFCRGIGISTSNGYLTAIKGFCRWLYEKERADRDRLVSLSRLNARTDLRHERRALPERELQAILTAAGVSPVDLYGLTGRDRMMLYATAMTTGFRASELASLVSAAFDLTPGSPTVTVKAAYSKNRRQAVQPLPADVAEALRGYLKDRPSNAPVWPGAWPKDAAGMLRNDLAAAGIPYRDDEGRVSDFHALRHSYITLLGRSGVSPKLAQELARHSDIRLTMNVYTHVRLHDLAGAVEGLPSLLTPDQDEALGATGTDPVCTGFAQTIDFGRSGVKPGETEKARSTDSGPVLNPFVRRAVEDNCASVRLVESELPGLDSNQDKESQNLLCYRYTTGYQDVDQATSCFNKASCGDFTPNS